MNSNFYSKIILVSIGINSVIGCANNLSGYNATSSPAAYSRTIQRANKEKHYFIMHSGVDSYRVTQAEVEKTKQQFTVHLAKIDSLPASGNAGGKKLHMYMKDSVSYTLDEPHTILISKIARIERMQ
jgi:hypothetical protein